MVSCGLVMPIYMLGSRELLGFNALTVANLDVKEDRSLYYCPSVVLSLYALAAYALAFVFRRYKGRMVLQSRQTGGPEVARSVLIRHMPYGTSKATIEGVTESEMFPVLPSGFVVFFCVEKYTSAQPLRLF